MPRLGRIVVILLGSPLLASLGIFLFMCASLTAKGSNLDANQRPASVGGLFMTTLVVAYVFGIVPSAIHTAAMKWV